MNASIKKTIERILPFLFVFVASIFKPNDPDLGWHLKYGEYFYRHGQILRDNAFSVMMPDFRWANISWVIDLTSFVAFHFGGFLGLSLLAGIVITLTFYFFSKAFDLSYWEKTLIFPFLFLIELPVNQISFRGQLMSILFIAILTYMIKKYEKNKSKIIYLTPLLFVLWGNLHGQFILGLAILVFWFIFYILNLFLTKELKNNLSKLKLLGISILLSLVAPLINPFGIEVYKTVIVHAFNPNLKDIMEYLPFDELSSQWWMLLSVGILVFFGLVYLFFEEKIKNQITSLGLFSILYILSWTVRRYAWSMYYFAIPFLKTLASFFIPGGKRITFYLSTSLFVIYLLITLFIKYPFSQFTNMSWEDYCRDVNKCSSSSVEFLKKNNLTQDLYSMYNWGGWMIWNYPEIKPTIDGRMHLWKDAKGYSGFEDYYGYEQNFKDINDSPYNVILMSPGKPVYKRLLELNRLGAWRLVYQDNNAGVFVRN